MIEVSMGLAGCGAGIAGLMNLSLVRLWGGAGGLLDPTLCKADETHADVSNWLQAGQRGGPTISESRGDGACIDDKPEQNIAMLSSVERQLNVFFSITTATRIIEK